MYIYIYIFIYIYIYICTYTYIYVCVCINLFINGRDAPPLWTTWASWAASSKLQRGTGSSCTYMQFVVLQKVWLTLKPASLRDARFAARVVVLRCGFSCARVFEDFDWLIDWLGLCGLGSTRYMVYLQRRCARVECVLSLWCARASRLQGVPIDDHSCRCIIHILMTDADETSW